MLAPMEDVTDTAMRTLSYNHGADITFTEMARFDSLAKKNEGTLEKVDLKNDIPTWIQIVGSKEQQLKRYLKDFEPQKGFLGFNFNLGCPNPSLTNNDMGCAMVGRIAKTRKLIQIVHDRGYKTSIKMRLGLNKEDKQNKIYLKLLSAVNTEMFIIHTRVGADTYDIPPDHKVLEECSQTGRTIIANGDINTKERVSEVLDYGAKGVMIGRSAICNPGIFEILKGQQSASIQELKKEYELLANKFETAQKYRKNVLKHLGKNISNENESING